MPGTIQPKNTLKYYQNNTHQVYITNFFGIWSVILDVLLKSFQNVSMVKFCIQLSGVPPHEIPKKWPKISKFTSNYRLSNRPLKRWRYTLTFRVENRHSDRYVYPYMVCHSVKGELEICILSCSSQPPLLSIIRKIVRILHISRFKTCIIVCRMTALHYICVPSTGSIKTQFSLLSLSEIGEHAHFPRRIVCLGLFEPSARGHLFLFMEGQLKASLRLPPSSQTQQKRVHLL